MTPPLLRRQTRTDRDIVHGNLGARRTTKE
ncbi:hypothetical protein EDD29_5843 [Actinocorallia herbida]|uniref:Uncharacterized protein n=1 Tax=Actinocorallia herbida TaxID=58109 RepID=A0A3N1D3S4_9ACTN|nr:hypothetical protein EDD29_5843 [Actinocorallia herbida]